MHRRLFCLFVVSSWGCDSSSPQRQEPDTRGDTSGDTRADVDDVTPETGPPEVVAECGDRVCQTGENCADCPADCGRCADACGGEACAVGATQCSGTTGYKVCGIDEGTGCSELGPFIGCRTNNTCTDTTCEGSCSRPEFMLLVDRSSSLSAADWGLIEDGVTGFARDYGLDALIGMRMFPGDAACDVNDAVVLAQDNAAAIRAGLVAPSATSATPLAAALSGLGAQLGDPNQGEAVILVTDGSETCAEPEAALDAARALWARGTRVFTIGLGAGYDGELLARIAAAAGGQTFVVSNYLDFYIALRDIAEAVIGCEQPEMFGIAACRTYCTTVCWDDMHSCGDTCVEDDDVAHCGDRCEPCPEHPNATPVCRDEQCGFVCDPSFHDCGGVCVSDAAVATCGDRCEVCPDAPNAGPVCTNGVCGVACDAGFHMCDGVCVSDLAVETCGASCTPCPTDPNGVAGCDGERCTLTCSEGKHGCDGVCVSDLALESCGTSCTPCETRPTYVTTCDGQQCNSICPEATHECAASCVSDDAVATCGSRCTACPGVDDGFATCVEGQCDVVRCEPGAVIGCEHELGCCYEEGAGRFMVRALVITDDDEVRAIGEREIDSSTYPPVYARRVGDGWFYQPVPWFSAAPTFDQNDEPVIATVVSEPEGIQLQFVRNGEVRTALLPTPIATLVDLAVATDSKGVHHLVYSYCHDECRTYVIYHRALLLSGNWSAEVQTGMGGDTLDVEIDPLSDQPCVVARQFKEDEHGNRRGVPGFACASRRWEAVDVDPLTSVWPVRLAFAGNGEPHVFFGKYDTENRLYGCLPEVGPASCQPIVAMSDFAALATGNDRLGRLHVLVVEPDSPGSNFFAWDGDSFEGTRVDLGLTYSPFNAAIGFLKDNRPVFAYGYEFLYP